MLLNKHRRENNGGRKDERSDLNAFSILKMFALYNCKVRAQRVVDMDARPKVGRCIRGVKELHQTGKYVISRHGVGPQVMTVRKKRRDNQKNGHSRKEKDTGAVIVILILKEEVKDNSRDVRKPQKVRDDKHFAERNHIIQCHVNHGVLLCHGFFQMTEPRQIDDTVHNQRNCVPIAFIKFFKFFHN